MGLFVFQMDYFGFWVNDRFEIFKICSKVIMRRLSNLLGRGDDGLNQIVFMEEREKGIKLGVIGIIELLGFVDGLDGAW